MTLLGRGDHRVALSKSFLDIFFNRGEIQTDDHGADLLFTGLDLLTHDILG